MYHKYNLEFFKRAVIEKEHIHIKPEDEIYRCIHPGEATGTIVGGNLSTFKLLGGTRYIPSLKNTILFLEDDYESDASHIDRDFESIVHSCYIWR